MPEIRDEEFAPASIVLSSQTEETIGDTSGEAPKSDEGLLSPINAVTISLLKSVSTKTVII